MPSDEIRPMTSVLGCTQRELELACRGISWRKPQSFEHLRTLVAQRDVDAAESALLTGNPGPLQAVFGDVLCTMVREGRARSLNVLMRAGADPDDASSNGLLPLQVAFSDDAFACGQVLLWADADPNLILQGTPLLVLAARKGRTRWVSELIDSGARLAAVDKAGLNAAHAAAAAGHVRVLTVLLAAGVDIEAKDQEGRTALALACVSGKRDCFRLLLKNNAAAFAVDHAGVSILDLVLKRDSSTWLPLLRDVGVAMDAPNARGILPFDYCESTNRVKCLRYLRRILRQPLPVGQMTLDGVDLSPGIPRASD